MPIYEYQCQACGGVNEVMQKVDAPAPDECEKCHKGPLAKMVSKTAFILKGNGWYVTDFRSGSGKSAAPASGSSGGEADSKPAETKTETKTETHPSPQAPKGASGVSS